MTHHGTPRLWSWEALVAAAGARTDGPAPAAVTGVSIDTRTIEPGDLFVALKDARDGHEFVSAAFAKGAVAALVADGYVRQAGDGALLRVVDPLRALEAIGRAARARLSPSARVIAITGSAGKTGTKEMLRACLATQGPTHASEKSYNNHWGVPLTLARMPADTVFAILEIGMNHAGEIAPLSLMVRPHIAIVTNVLPVHLGHFPSEAAIADAKAEVMLGLVSGGGMPVAAAGQVAGEPEAGTTRILLSSGEGGRVESAGRWSLEPAAVIILNRDNRHFDQLRATAQLLGLRVVSFGRATMADVRATLIEPNAAGSIVVAASHERELQYAVGAPGEHIALNSLAVAAALTALPSLDIDAALRPLAEVAAAVGRGQRTCLPAPEGRILLIDESYNANPASVAAALAAMATVPRGAHPRRIAVLGQMLELGPNSRELHLGLKGTIDAATIDRVLVCGPDMQALYDVLEPSQRVADGCTATSVELAEPLLALVEAGDVVMIKGSLGTRMAPLVAALKARYGA